VSHTALNRRELLAMAGGALATLGWSSRSHGDDRPSVTDPRATSGDAAHEPDWKSRLSMTVGPDKADLVGNSDRAIQAAVDYIARLGGGTVHILPGEYRLRNAVYLQSKVRLRGSGDNSVLIKEPSVRTKLAADSDWYDQEITLADAAGFRVGDGVCLQTTNPHNGGSEVLKRTLVARSGNRFKLDRPLRKNFWLMGESTAASLFPIINCENVAHVAIEDITLDGNREQNENLDGNHAGCIFAQDCSRLTFRDVTARNYNGDGISWQICHDVRVEDCTSQNNAGLGLHPGSGSQRPLIRGNRVVGNDIGIFFCWGVKYGLAEDNVVEDTRRHGISIGHRDTNNLIRGNTVRNSGEVGVLFRPERGHDFAPHHNRLEDNQIVNVGNEDGVGVDVRGETESVTITGNDVRETNGPAKRVGIRVGAETRDIRLNENDVEGFSVDVERM